MGEHGLFAGEAVLTEALEGLEDADDLDLSSFSFSSSLTFSLSLALDARLLLLSFCSLAALAEAGSAAATLGTDAFVSSRLGGSGLMLVVVREVTAEGGLRVAEPARPLPAAEAFLLSLIHI